MPSNNQSDEIKQIIESVLEHAGNEILIGGQAIAYWARLYKLDFIGTKDIDFLGDAQAARMLADQLQADIHIPSWDDHTPNTAAVIISTNTEDNYEVDYLGSVIGLDEKQITKRALTVQYGNKILKVMHPIDCLDSRIANLSLLKDKQTEAGVQQADTAIQIVKQFLLGHETSKNSDERYLLNMAERLIDITLSHNGRRVFARWNIDTLETIPKEIMPDAFIRHRWPRILQEVTDKRAHYLKHYEQPNTATPEPDQ